MKKIINPEYLALKDFDSVLKAQKIKYNPDCWIDKNGNIFHSLRIGSERKARAIGLIPRPSFQNLWDLLPDFLEEDGKKYYKQIRNGENRDNIFSYTSAGGIDLLENGEGVGIGCIIIFIIFYLSVYETLDLQSLVNKGKI